MKTQRRKLFSVGQASIFLLPPTHKFRQLSLADTMLVRCSHENHHRQTKGQITQTLFQPVLSAGINTQMSLFCFPNILTFSAEELRKENYVFFYYFCQEPKHYHGQAAHTKQEGQMAVFVTKLNYKNLF